MLSQIDWSRPWYDAVRAAFAPLADVAPDGLLAALNGRAQALALANAKGQPLVFIAQAELPEGRSYEEYIGASGRVPTRANLHDFFNALVWLSFPRIKVELNALQAAQIARDGIGKSRGPARDAATIFDENAAILAVRDTAGGHALVAALRAHAWSEAFCTRRAAFGTDAELWLFGHALMEKLVGPRKAITAHTRVLFVDDGFFAQDHDGRRATIDAKVASQLAAEGLDTSSFTPVPVLGVPGWWPGQDAEFYADSAVFRPKRLAAVPS